MGKGDKNAFPIGRKAMPVEAYLPARGPNSFAGGLRRPTIMCSYLTVVAAGSADHHLEDLARLRRQAGFARTPDSA